MSGRFCLLAALLAAITALVILTATTGVMLWIDRANNGSVSVKADGFFHSPNDRFIGER